MVIRLGRLRLAQGDNVDTVDDRALKDAQGGEWFIMEGTDMALTTWLREEVNLPIATDADE